MVWKQLAVTWVVWQTLFCALYFVAESFGLWFHLGDVMWAVLGFRPDFYSFASLWLPRCILFAIVSAPPTVLGILVFQAMSARGPQIGLRGWLFVVAIVAVLASFRMPDPSRAFSGQLTAVLFVAYCLALTAVFCFLIARQERQRARN
jgi:hypothetical protein